MRTLRKSYNYLAAQTKWLLAGCPNVTDKVRDHRYSLCLACEKRDPIKNECTACSCPLVRTALGDKLSMATEECPLKKWLSVVDVVEEAPYPTWRQVLSWVDDVGKPIYVDGLSLTPDDVVVLDGWTEPDAGMGEGIGRRWEHVRDVAPRNGELKVIVEWDCWTSRVTSKMRVEIKYGKIRFKNGVPVEVCQ